MKHKLLNTLTIIGMLIVFATSTVQASERIAEARPSPSYGAGEAIIVDEKDVVIYQIMLAEIKYSDGTGFIRSPERSSPFDVQFIASARSASMFVDWLTKEEMLSVMAQPQIATLIDQEALVVMSDQESTLLHKIEILPKRLGDDIRTTITLTHKEKRDGKIHSSAQIGNVNYHARLGDDTTMFLVGQLGNKDILLTVKKMQYSEIR